MSRPWRRVILFFPMYRWVILVNGDIPSIVWNVQKMHLFKYTLYISILIHSKSPACAMMLREGEDRYAKSNIYKKDAARSLRLLTRILLDPNSNISRWTRCSTFSILWILLWMRKSFLSFVNVCRPSTLWILLKDTSRTLGEKRHTGYKNA